MVKEEEYDYILEEHLRYKDEKGRFVSKKTLETE